MQQVSGCIETIKVKNFKPQMLHLHMRRLKKSIQALERVKPELDFLEDEILSYLNTVPLKDFVLRLEYNSSTGYSFSHRPLPPTKVPAKVAIYRKITLPIFKLSWIKRSDRTLYNEASRLLEWYDLDDFVLLNEEGNVCETTNANIFIKTPEGYATPSLDQGCVDGVYRNKFINDCRRRSIPVEQRPIKPEELKDGFFLSNAIRGFFPAVLVNDIH